MRTLYELANDINAYLQGQGIYETCYPTYDDKLVIDIHRGDWKHDHHRIDAVMVKFFHELCDDYKLETHYSETTETDGSDNYSADHYYVVEPINDISPFSVEDEIETPTYVTEDTTPEETPRKPSGPFDPDPETAKQLAQKYSGEVTKLGNYDHIATITTWDGTLKAFAIENGYPIRVGAGSKWYSWNTEDRMKRIFVSKYQGDLFVQCEKRRNKFDPVNESLKQIKKQ